MRFGAFTRRAFSWILALCLSLGAAFGALLVFDRMVASELSTGLPGRDSERNIHTARTLELYPYTGWHVQANVRASQLRPDATGLGEPDLGPKGFAVDFDVENPPPKQAGEFRIILIGGSGAQGWGASRPDQTMGRILESQLRDSGKNVRVINMAMGSNITYQNFIALNRYGHKLRPDLILSYSGVNDYVVPMIHEPMSDVHYQFHQLRALTIAARGTEFPPGLVWLRDWFPNIATRTQFGYVLKTTLYPKWLEARALEIYRSQRGPLPTEPTAFLSEVVVPEYVAALRSIKRDFDGVPMVVIWQALAPREITTHIDFFKGSLPADFYGRMFDAVRAGTAGYRDSRWHFADFHAENMRNPHPLVAVHPTGEGQRVVADFMAREILMALEEWAIPLSGLDTTR